MVIVIGYMAFINLESETSNDAIIDSDFSIHISSNNIIDEIFTANIDLGHIKFIEKIQKSISLKNSLDEDITISKVSSTCGCSILNVTQDIIPKNAIKTYTLSYEIPKRLGLNRNFIKMDCDANDLYGIVLDVKSIFEPIIRLSQYILYIKHKENQPERQLHHISIEQVNEALTYKGFECNMDGIDLAMQPGSKFEKNQSLEIISDTKNDCVFSVWFVAYLFK